MNRVNKIIAINKKSIPTIGDIFENKNISKTEENDIKSIYKKSQIITKMEKSGLINTLYKINIIL